MGFFKGVTLSCRKSLAPLATEGVDGDGDVDAPCC